jgi:hypothetical protein
MPFPEPFRQFLDFMRREMAGGNVEGVREEEIQQLVVTAEHPNTKGSQVHRDRCDRQRHYWESITPYAYRCPRS